MDIRLIKNKPLFKSNEINDFLNYNINDCLSLKSGELKKVLFNDELFLILQNTELKDSKECIFESHKEYFDIHYIIEGKEKMKLIELNNLETPYESNILNDYYLYRTNKLGDEVILNKNEFIIFPFDTVHKVGIISDDLDNTIIKIVIKIKKSLFDKELVNG